LVERRSFVEMPCSIAQCLDIIGDAWTLLIVRDAFAGTTRFDQFQHWLTIPRNTLTDRLEKLVSAGIMTKQARTEHATRCDYVLTEQGRELWPILAAMRQWGDRYGKEGRPERRAVHASCGTPITTVTLCDTCGEQVHHDDVVLRDLSPTSTTPSRRPASAVDPR
jgi:DNA-binding HxlR family transcriptional regulator